MDVLLRERNVTRAAEQLGITQPAMSNGLRRLRDLFQDPLLLRTSEGMTPTEKAKEIQPLLRDILNDVQQIVEPSDDFDAVESKKVFRIMCSDYAEATLLPNIVTRMRTLAPNIIFDCLTPSDVSYKDMELGKVDMAINRFNEMPSSFHQNIIWHDNFSCLINKNNPLANDWTLDSYVAAHHIWVSKTGMGVGFGVNPEKSGGLGWVDQALSDIGKRRRITLFTRHYSMPALVASNNDLVATLPTRVAEMQAKSFGLILKSPPFAIPDFEFKMAWSPVLQSNAAHRWLRRLIMEEAEKISHSADEAKTLSLE